ncbi:DNA cytosine methyltransferase [Salmonella enterica]|nr:DNA cytosine methyltransferase [Salmonella enterica]EKT7778329.1 DNA cytosine methyltransferase [Salmonella enterica]
MSAFYNEIDGYPATWLTNLIANGLIADGVVDERSIVEVVPSDVIGKTQCHWFAGIGVWSYALRLAGWPDSRPVWTASLPCQPWSSAGKGGKFEDERHLWPVFFRLVKECRPPVIFGEQVSSKDGLEWFSTVQTDLENAGYAVAAVDTCAASVGAPHIRQRLFWMAYDYSQQYKNSDKRCIESNGKESCGKAVEPAGYSGTCWMEHPNSQRQQRRLCGREDPEREIIYRPPGCNLATGQLATEQRTAESIADINHTLRPMPVDSFWRDTDWLFCQDGKWRPVEPTSFPLAHGVAGRVGQLRAYGNAIVAPLAAAFISSASSAIQTFESDLKSAGSSQ